MDWANFDKTCSFSFDGSLFSIKMIDNFGFDSKIFALDVNSIMAEPDVQEGSNYDKVMELNSMTEESLSDLFCYSGNKTFLINYLFLKIWIFILFTILKIVWILRSYKYD